MELQPPSPRPRPRPRVSSLHVIYDADGTRTGELIYIAKKLLGLAHCAACDITHGPRREKPEFTQLKLAWPVPVLNIHRDEMDPAMAAAVRGVLPCVVARTPVRDVVVMGPDHLERCDGDVLRFAASVRACVEDAALDLPDSPAEACSLRIRDVTAIRDDAPSKQDDMEDIASLSSSGDAVVPTSLF